MPAVTMRDFSDLTGNSQVEWDDIKRIEYEPGTDGLAQAKEQCFWVTG